MKTHLTLPLLIAAAAACLAAEPTKPIADAAPVFEERDGLAAIEAEHFHKQTLADKRAWQLTSPQHTPDARPDGDPPHLAGASGGAYVECLPDTRANHGQKLIKGENFSDEPGQLAVLHYKVHFNTPGRYYVWVRAFSSGSEDNGIHVGLDGAWPDSGRRMQWCEGKQTWRWDSKQRTEANHCGEPYKIFLDIARSGEHEIMFSLREDGFEFDKFFLTTNRELARPEDIGPSPRVKSGKLPPAFAAVAAPAAARKFPAHWGTPPPVQTMDYRPLPGGYGHGSSTMVNWIQQNLDKDAAAKSGVLAMTAQDFIRSAKGYYLDKGKWLAIHPEKNQSATATAAFPFPAGKYDVTLHVVGESDGQSTFQLAVNDTKLGDFTAPPSTQTFEEGPKFSTTWKGVTISKGNVLTVSSQIASADGKEWSRARVARVEFAPADDATKAAVAKLAAAKPAPAATAKSAGAPLVLPRQPDGKGAVALTGELKQWHKVTLTLDGPFAHERDTQPNPFTALGFNVTFTHESGAPKYTVPGYFAADGNAGDSSADAGTKWRAHLSPDKTGKWNYIVSFRRGANAALDGGGQPVVPFDGVKGSFTIMPTDKTNSDFRAQGRLTYVGKHYLQFAGSRQYFLKAGPDSPETMLAFSDFDNTTTEQAGKGPLKTWSPHAGDWKAGDPTWKGGKGKNLIGALNYLAAKGMNAFSFLTYNAAGDGDNVWPFIERNQKLHYDCSKLDQWSVVFDHATTLGLYLHFKLQENESDDNRQGMDRKPRDIPASLDGGKLGIERKLYCRELIARFGHALALNWNIGEENTQSTEEVQDMVKYLHETDPYRHHIVLHTFPPQLDEVYRPLLGDKSLLTGVSMQTSWKQSHKKTLQWRSESAATGRAWVVAHDEQNPASLGVPPDPGYKGHSGIAEEKAPPKGKEGEGFVSSEGYTIHDIRKSLVWGHYLAGGAGLEYYFGYKLPENDLNCEDFRSRDKSWDYCRIALDFFRDEKIPFIEMSNHNGLIGNIKDDNSKFCFAQSGELYLVYLPSGGATDIDLTAAKGTFTVKWFNPRTGGVPAAKGGAALKGGSKGTLAAPSADDWLAVIAKEAASAQQPQ